MKRLACLALGLAIALAPATAQDYYRFSPMPDYRERLTDAQVRREIIRQSIANYRGECPCPYSVARNGRSCGPRRAGSRRGGAAPRCYPRDVSAAQVRAWRASNP